MSENDLKRESFLALPPAQLEDHPYELWGQNVRGNFYSTAQMITYSRACLALQAAEADEALRISRQSEKEAWRYKDELEQDYADSLKALASANARIEALEAVVRELLVLSHHGLHSDQALENAREALKEHQ